MYTIAKIAAVLALAVAGTAALAGGALAQAAPPARPPRDTLPPIVLPQLTKQSTPSTGPLQPGDVVDYVLTYDYGNVPAGSVHIVDKLSNGLSYLPPSLMAVGWSHGTPPYFGNAETYTNLNPGPAKSFIVNVPVGTQSQPPSGQSAGDGFKPIPVGSKVYAIFHHENYHSAQINCWDLSSFAGCSGYPKSLDQSTADPRTTPQIVYTAVVGPPGSERIYYPSASHDTVQDRTYFGIGCWDTSTAGSACPFIRLPTSPSLNGKYESNGYNTNTYKLYTVLAGVVADPNNPSRLFMFAIDKVYCVDVSSPTNPVACAGWAPATLTGMPSDDGFLDIMVEQSAPTKIYVHYGTTAGRATVACVNTSDGKRCSGWPSTDARAIPTTPPTRYGILSPVLDPSGSTMTSVCLHPYLGGPSTDTVICFDANGNDVTSTTGVGTALATVKIIGAFRIPGTPQVLYARYQDTPAISCYDFSTSQFCFPFAQGWGSGPALGWPGLNRFEDYGYAVDPAAPDRCLLGLGNQGILWRFARDGSFDAGGCTSKISQTFDVDGLFCSIKPKEMTWASINLINAPLELSPNSPITLSQGGQPFWSGTVGQAVNGAIPVNKATLLSQGPVTLDFAPAYNGQPKNGYQLQVLFSSDVDPQICYKATVQCGVVSNRATLAIDGKPVGDPQIVDLGTATGPTCASENAGLLKVCKVAGPGIAVGTPFVFTVGNSTVSVPAGPPPGGTCTVVSTFPVGTHVVVQEKVPPGVTVAGIAVASPNQVVGQPNLPGGSVEVTVGAGVTVVTFTDKRTGYLEICKRGEGTGSFTVKPDGLGPFVVAAGTCTPPIEVVAGTVTIGEAPGSGIAMVDCGTFPPGRDRGCDRDKQTFAVDVVPGDVSAETVAFITNRRSKGGPASGRGSTAPGRPRTP